MVAVNLIFILDIKGNVKKFSVDRTKENDPEYQEFPSCFDPTYCETNPPVPKMNNTQYSKPEIASLRYNDGEVVTYQCLNPSKEIIIMQCYLFIFITCIK